MSENADALIRGLMWERALAEQDMPSTEYWRGYVRGWNKHRRKVARQAQEIISNERNERADAHKEEA